MQKVKLSVNELFSGLGRQGAGIRDTGLFDVEVKCTSDIDKDVTVSYAAINCGLTNEMIKTYIQTFDSARDIQNELGFFESNINKACKGKIHTAYGYIWRYADEPS